MLRAGPYGSPLLARPARTPESHGLALRIPVHKSDNGQPHDRRQTASPQQAETHRLTADGGPSGTDRPSIESNRTSRFASPDRRQSQEKDNGNNTFPGRASGGFASFGAVMKDASGSSHKSCYL